MFLLETLAFAKSLNNAGPPLRDVLFYSMAVATATNGYLYGDAPGKVSYGADGLDPADEIQRCSLLGGTFAILVQVRCTVIRRPARWQVDW